jgi:cytochrome c biogenesis protein CcdA/thiol-disulfide isomerase/thioredoxin
MLLFFVAVLGGAASVLTPCVLPLLPAILVVSRESGRARVWGIALGIEASFFVLAVGLAGAISALGLPANTLRYVAAVAIGVAGLVLIVPRLEAAFATAVARLTARLPQRRAKGSGFGAGFVAGVPLGVVWAPCAGPILAGITVAAASTKFSSRTLVIASGYALGMIGPLAAVILGGTKLSARLRRALGGGRRVLAPMGAVLVATALLIGLGGLDRVNAFIATHVNLTSTPTANLEKRALGGKTSTVHLSKLQLEASGYPDKDGLSDLGPAPGFSGITHWFNSKPLTLQELRGKVVLVDFWTYSCINCIRTLPHLKALDAKYRKDGLVIVGVHTPEFAFERDAGNVGKAVKSFGIHYPVALDPKNATWNNYYNEYWPAHYLIDRNGTLRSVHYGEGAYVTTENEIRTLLGMRADASGRNEDVVNAMTPETYLASNRAERYAGSPNLHDGDVVYSRPRSPLDSDEWAYGGVWNVGGQHATAGRDAKLYLQFRASNVYLVAGPPSSGKGAIHVSTPDGSKDVTVDRYQLYTLRSGAPADELLTIDASPGVQVYSFTFG